MNPIPYRPHLLTACLALAAAATVTACAPATAPVTDTGAPATAATGAASPDAATGSGTPPVPAAQAGASGDADLARAQAAAKAFSSQLRGELQAAMVAGGPIAAVDVCHTRAPRIADEVMAESGVRLGRVALPGRNRNPGQAAGDWQLATLLAFQQAVEGGAAAADQVAMVRDGLPDGVALRMMRGIATEPGCLACHGKDVAEPIRVAIAQRYPDDQATGFAVGDLRGALWVEVPAATPATVASTP